MIRIGPLKLKMQIFRGDESAIGPGKADLLEAIEREGSISAAGRALGMSYRRTWMLVDGLNRCWAERVVETVAGGGPDRGARVTPFGRELVATYRALEERIAEAVSGPQFDMLLARLKPEMDEREG